MKSTFSVIFYLKRQVVKKDGTVPVMGRITVDGTQTQFSSKLSVDPKLWDTKGGQYKRVGELYGFSIKVVSERILKEGL